MTCSPLLQLKPTFCSADKPDESAGPFTYRGDLRGPEVIFNQGFTPRGTGNDLYRHAQGLKGYLSIFISTSKDRNVVAYYGSDFNRNAGYVYTVRPRNGIDVNLALGSRSPLPLDQEVAVPYGIHPSDIRDVTPVDQRGRFVGSTVLNPGFSPR
jgi:hypothetical protein